MRPAPIATDEAKIIDAVLHAIDLLSKQNETYDILVLLQPTQPLRNRTHIDESLELFIEKEVQSLLSVCQTSENPVLIRKMSDKNTLERILTTTSTVRRQDMSKYYFVNGAIYINLISELNNKTSFNDNKIGYEMPKEYSLDIDEPFDLVIAEELIKKHT